MYGWAWFIGFTGIYLINTGVEGAGTSDEVLALLWNALPVLLVGVLYLAGGGGMLIGTLVTQVHRMRVAKRGR